MSNEIDWSKVPSVDPGEEYMKRKTLRIKKTLDLIAKHPEGATQEDFRNAGLTPYGISRLQQLGQIVSTQVKEPERGPRCFHWLWKIRKETKADHEN